MYLDNINRKEDIFQMKTEEDKAKDHICAKKSTTSGL